MLLGLKSVPTAKRVPGCGPRLRPGLLRPTSTYSKLADLTASGPSKKSILRNQCQRSRTRVQCGDLVPCLTPLIDVGHQVDKRDLSRQEDISRVLDQLRRADIGKQDRALVGLIELLQQRSRPLRLGPHHNAARKEDVLG